MIDSSGAKDPPTTNMTGESIDSYPAFENVNGSALRIAIVHARWNKSVIQALIQGAIAKLKESGVLEHNIVIQSVPGSFELPLACQRCVSRLAHSTPHNLLGFFFTVG